MDVSKTDSTGKVVLFSSYAHMSAWQRHNLHESRKRGNQPDACTNIPYVATLADWISELWTLFGDGRTLVDVTQREIACSLAYHDAGINASPTTAMLAAKLSSAASGLPEFEAALLRVGNTSYEAITAHTSHASTPHRKQADAEKDDPSKAEATPKTKDPFSRLSAPEQTMLAMISKARRALHQAGMIEKGEVYAALPHILSKIVRKTGHPLADVVTLHVVTEPSTVELQFLKQCRDLGVIGTFAVKQASTDVGKAAAENKTKIRFAFPSGRYAQPRLVTGIVKTMRKNEKTLIIAKDAASLYENIAPALLKEGIVCALQARRRFAETDFGRAWCSLYRFIHNDTATATDLTDYLLTSFSGISIDKAQKIDAQMRHTCCFEKDACLQKLQEESQMFAWMTDLVAGSACTDSVLEIQRCIHSMSLRSKAWQSEQIKALEKFKDIVNRASDMQNEPAKATKAAPEAAYAADIVFRVICSSTIDISRIQPCDVGGEHDSSGDIPTISENRSWDVLVTTFTDAAAKEPGSYANAILCDMDAASYPALVRTSAADTLLEKLGIQRLPESAVWPENDKLFCTRSSLCSVVNAAERHIIICRCLFDADANPTYPAAVVEELTEGLCPECLNEERVKPYSLPKTLLSDIVTLGEEELFENAVVCDLPQPVAAHIKEVPFSEVSPDCRLLVLPPHTTKGTSEARTLFLSPSQIEVYLECPCKWFVEKKLHTSKLDVEFGPAERGTFAHETLRRFFTLFREKEGAASVTSENLPAARKIMKTVLSEIETPPEVTGELEHRDLASLKRQLLRYLDFEARLLPGYETKHVELKIPPDAGFVYAGCIVQGFIDRIDVDNTGKAVVVDYKDSAHDDYDLRAKKAPTPRKVQALIYAQALRRIYGLEVAAALYVSYGRKQRLSGAYDPALIGATALPEMTHTACRTEDGQHLADVLDATEAYVARAIDRLKAGDIAPCPIDDSACTWCPALNCPMREEL